MRRALILAPVALAILAALYLGIGLLVAARLSAPAPQQPERTPRSVGLPYEEAGLRSEDGVRLAAWWMEAAGSDRAAVLVHGFGGDKSNEQILQTARLYAEGGYSVLALDLRGHGESGGARRTLGYREVRDVQAALAWLAEGGYEPGRVVLHGWSMGGATVVRSAPGTGVAAVVEEAGYADLPLLLRDELPENSGLPRFFTPGTLLAAKLFLGFDAGAVVPKDDAARLREEGTPLLVIHSTADRTVRYRHAELFVQAYPGAELWRLGGYGHVEAHEHPDYEERLGAFLGKALPAVEGIRERGVREVRDDGAGAPSL